MEIRIITIVILIILLIGAISEYPWLMLPLIIVGGVLSGYERDDKS